MSATPQSESSTKAPHERHVQPAPAAGPERDLRLQGWIDGFNLRRIAYDRSVYVLAWLEGAQARRERRRAPTPDWSDGCRDCGGPSPLPEHGGLCRHCAELRFG